MPNGPCIIPVPWAWVGAYEYGRCHSIDYIILYGKGEEVLHM